MISSMISQTLPVLSGCTGGRCGLSREGDEIIVINETVFDFSIAELITPATEPGAGIPNDLQ